eukprot:352800-Chlamydomonas_euryale.AAC.2
MRNLYSTYFGTLAKLSTSIFEHHPGVKLTTHSRFCSSTPSARIVDGNSGGITPGPAARSAAASARQSSRRRSSSVMPEQLQQQAHIRSLRSASSSIHCMGCTAEPSRHGQSSKITPGKCPQTLQRAVRTEVIGQEVRSTQPIPSKSHATVKHQSQNDRTRTCACQLSYTAKRAKDKAGSEASKAAGNCVGNRDCQLTCRQVRAVLVGCIGSGATDLERRKASRLQLPDLLRAACGGTRLSFGGSCQVDAFGRTKAGTTEAGRECAYHPNAQRISPPHIRTLAHVCHLLVEHCLHAASVVHHLDGARQRRGRQLCASVAVGPSLGDPRAPHSDEGGHSWRLQTALTDLTALFPARQMQRVVGVAVARKQQLGAYEMEIARVCPRPATQR